MDAADDLGQRRLAGPVLADQAVDGGGRDRHAHVVHGLDAAEALDGAPDLNQRWCQSSYCPSNEPRPSLVPRGSCSSRVSKLGGTSSPRAAAIASSAAFAPADFSALT